MNISRRSSRRRGLAATSAAALALAALAAVPPAQAAEAGNPFAIDGAVPDAGAVQLLDPSGSSQELGPLNSNATKLGVIHTATPPMLGTTNPNAQVDLRKIWLDAQTNVSSPPQAGDDGDTWLYIAWERDSNKGSGVIMYEFMKDQEPAACDYDGLSTDQLIASCNPWANRQAGDFILVWDQQGNTIDIILRTWQLVGGVLALDAGVSLTGNGNAFATTGGGGFFGEAAVNLTDTVFAGAAAECTSFANVIPGTVTGNSDTADYKDTVLADVSDFITISNCGSVRITKQTDPADGTGSFDYTLDRSGGGAIRYAADGYSGEQLTAATGTLVDDGDSETVVDLIAASDYSLAEADPGPEYQLTSIICSLGGVNYDALTGDIPVVVGMTTDCTITNTLQPGTLIVKKVVINDNGGTATAEDFSFSVDGAAAVAFEADGQNDLTVDAGTYDVTEPAVTGYTTTYDNCTDVAVPAGGEATCTITNDDQPGTLVVQKVVVNDNGGTATAEDFSFSVDGGAAVAFEADGQNELTVDAGTYDVTEPAVTGYTTTYDNCTDIVVTNGGSATCVITNDDDKASPTGATTQSWVLQDSLELSGLRTGASDAVDATVTFRLWSDSSCTALVGSETAAISGTSAATTTGVTVTGSGTYYWTAQYSGDSYNNGFTTSCGSEVTQILAKDAVHDDLS